MYRALDIFFLIFHSGLTLFNLLGWIFKFSRRLNLVTLLLTFIAWFGLGIFYGIGYCPLTDWHWKVLIELGATDLPNSYITYLLRRLFWLNVSESLVDVLTVVLFFSALFLSVILNIRDRKRKQDPNIKE